LPRKIKPSQSTLAAPSRLSSGELLDVATIQVGIRSALKENSIVEISLNTLKRLGEQLLTRKSTFRKKPIGSLKFDEAMEVQIENVTYCVFKAVVKDGGIDADYACLIDKTARKISVVPYGTYAKAHKLNNIKIIEDLLDSKTRGFINAYVDHEITTDANEAIDPYIARNMLAGNYAVTEEVADSKPELYGHMKAKRYDETELKALLVSLGKFLTAIGVKDPSNIIKTLEDKPLVFIPYDNMSELPSYTVSGTKVKVTAHSSPFATYIFLSEGYL